MWHKRTPCDKLSDRAWRPRLPELRASAAWFAYLLVASLLVSTVQGQVYRMPMDFDEGLDLAQRAETTRQSLSEFIGQDADFAQQALQLLPGQPVNPLVPEEPRLAQVPDGPSWGGADPSELPATATPGIGSVGGSRIRIDPRGSSTFDLRRIPNGAEQAWVVNQPVQITMTGDQGPVELSADRIVVWTDDNVVSLSNLEASQMPIEIYSEGNIQFRQAGNIGLAQRMYYNVNRQSGVILEAELFAETKQRQGGFYDDFRTPFRLKADVVQQLSPTLFQANNAAFTTSRLGIPRYWIESEALSLNTGSTPLFDQLSQGFGSGFFGTSEAELYQSTDANLGGQPGSAQFSTANNPFAAFDQLLVTSENTRLFVAGVPVFKWPRFSADLANNPSLYLDRIRVGSDGVLGQQLLTRWNNFQLLGVTPRPDRRWTTDIDYLTDRGLGFGTDFDYRATSVFGRPALSRGYFHSWFINDDGSDNLGFDRRSVAPEETFRGRIDGKHIHLTPSGLQVIGELGWLSDRNFLEQYREQEWDLEKDQETRVEIKKYTGSGLWSVGAGIRLNDFFTQTEWLPRADHYQLGRGLLGNRLSWFEHSQIGYARLRVADAPTNSVDRLKFDPLAWEREVEGVRAISRQEVDLPLQLGPINVVPYLLGEAGYWQEDLNGNDVTRLLGQAGVRSSMLMWRADPTISNELFNLNGIAHKIVVDSEFLYADANQNYLNLPLYDPLDDDSVEFFRRRFLFDTFLLGVGDDVPLRFDERAYAFRQGMQRYVAAPSSEIADDLMMLRLGLRQRIQTKRGRLGNQRIVDWMTFDIESHFFPRSDRDNFGQEIGPTQYDFRWHVGDRTTLMSDGYFDFFGDGLRTVSLAAALTRPGRSQYVVGLRSIEGPVSSNVLTKTVSYRLSPKWKVEYGISIDFSDTGNLGQSGRIVRIGESVLVGVGGFYDASRNNFGLRFDIAPRFVRSKLGMIGGRPIEPVGAFGLQ